MMLILLITMLPVILAAILNMIWVNVPALKETLGPMDNGRLLADGKRLLGDNKTWKGFWGMVVFTALTTTAFHSIVIIYPAANNWSLLPFDLYQFPWEPLLYGAIWGLAYVLAELPNSYIKRRLNIGAGENANGLKGAFFLIVDQADSVLGCVIVMPLFCDLTLGQAIGMLVLGTIVHLLVNMMLFVVNLKKQPC
jgi:hypothetical protein